MSKYLLSTPPEFGPAASRPATAAPGQAYVGTDTGTISYYDAATQTWYTVGGSVATPKLLAHSASQTATAPAINATGANLIVVAGHAYGAVPTDNLGNVYSYNGGAALAGLWYCENPTVSNALTVTLAGYSGIVVAAFEYAAAATDINAVANVANGNGTPITVSGTALLPNELCVVSYNDYGSGATTAVSASAGWTPVQSTFGSGYSAAMWYAVPSAAGSVSATLTPTNTGSVAYSACLLSFQT